MQRLYRLHPSWQLALLYSLLCIALIVPLFLLSMPMSVPLLLSGSMAAWAVHLLRQNALLHTQQSCVALRLDGASQVVLQLRDGRHLSGRIAQDSVVMPFMVILNVRLGRQRTVRSVLVMPDSMGADSFRRLCIALRWSEQTTQAVL